MENESVKSLAHDKKWWRVPDGFLLLRITRDEQIISASLKEKNLVCKIVAMVLPTVVPHIRVLVDGEIIGTPGKGPVTWYAVIKNKFPTIEVEMDQDPRFSLFEYSYLNIQEQVGSN